MTIQLSNYNDSYQSEVKALYESSFSEEERKPFSRLLKMYKRSTVDFLIITEENGTFLGFIFMESYKDLVFVDYFAIMECYRSNGVGSKTLLLITKELYSTKRILLEINMNDNSEENQRRKTFYIRNGFTVNPYEVHVFGVRMIMMSTNGFVPFEEYFKLRKHYASVIQKCILQTKITCKPCL